MNKKKFLSVKQPNNLYELIKKGIKICVITSNRKYETQIAEKLKTCKDVGMQIPALFTDARAAFEAGYKLEDAFTDKEITEENVDLYVVILEGNTRFWAFKSEMSPYPYSTSGPFEYTFMYKEIESGEQFMKLYRQINMTNYPLTVKDYGKDLAATEGGNKVLIEYTKLTSDLGMNSRAASFFLASSEITKHDVVKAYKGKMPDVFKDETILKQFESIIGAYKHRFVKNEKMFPIAKGVGIPSWLASKVNEAADKEIVVSRLCEMLNKMSADDRDKITGAKKTDSKKLDEVLKGVLNEIYDRVK